MDYADAGTLRIARPLYDFVNTEAMPGTGVDAGAFWRGYGAARPRSGAAQPGAAGQARCAAGRDRRTGTRNRGKPFDPRPTSSSCAASAICDQSPRPSPSAPPNVDPEIATIAGPQLVVPVTNARYALNAANARWGSLYDALYGTDAHPRGRRRHPRRRLQQDPRRTRDRQGARDPRQAAPLAAGSHAGRHRLYALPATAVRMTLKNGGQTRLAEPGRSSSAIAAMPAAPSAILLKHHGLHIEIVDRPQPSRSARTDAGRHCRCRAGSGASPRSRTARIRSPPSTPTTRCSPIATGSA